MYSFPQQTVPISEQGCTIVLQVLQISVMVVQHFLNQDTQRLGAFHNQTVHHVDTNGSKTTSAHLEIQKCCQTHARLIGGSNGPIMHVCRCALLLGTLRKDVITTVSVYMTT